MTRLRRALRAALDCVRFAWGALLVACRCASLVACPPRVELVAGGRIVWTYRLPRRELARALRDALRDLHVEVVR